MRTSRSSPLAILCFVFIAGATGCGTNTLSGGGGFPGEDGSRGDNDGGVPDLASTDLATGTPCGDTFCAVGQVCELGVCHADCNKAVRCGAPPKEVCCAMSDVCYLGTCTTPGAACGGGGGGCGTSSCTDGSYCEMSIGHCLPLAKTGMCEYHPPVGAFSPKVKWEWMGSAVLPAYSQIMMTPVVADLDGNCMPDIVFSTFTGGNYSSDGVVRAVRGDGKGELWTAADNALRTIPGAQIALADIDRDGKVEIFACSASGALLALNFDGTKRWITAERPCSWDAPLVADLDHDGMPEVVVGFSVFNAATGALKNKPPAVARPMIGNTPYGYYDTVAELDGNDGNGMEIVAGGVVAHLDGTLYWDKSGGQTGYAAVADLDGDGLPDVVSVVPGTHTVNAYKHDGTLLWGGKDVNNGVATPQGPSGGGPPTVADFDGNGKPDVATAGGYGYLVLNGQTGGVLWQSTMTTDTSSRVTGSSVFDFEGDGPAEAVYNDEHNLRVYAGKDGKVLVKLCSTSGTLWENPVIVDVDADDHAEIVVMANNYAINKCDQDTGAGASHTGFKVIGDAMNRWVRTRRIWNQHAYHVTNVNDDGTIPKTEAPNWTQPGLDNFRQNVQTHNVFAAPDLVPRDLRAVKDKCAEDTLTLVATVVNQGEATAPAAIPVTFYRITQNATLPIATVMTKAPILPGASETVSYDWGLPMVNGMADKGPFSIDVVVDDSGKALSGVVNECDEGNNASLPAMLGCPAIG